MELDQHRINALRKLPDDELVRATEAAALIGVSTKTLMRNRRDGLKPPFIPSGKEPVGRAHSTSPVHYRKGDLDAYIKGDRGKIHAYLINTNGLIIGEPGRDIDWDNVVVGPINDLLLEEQWDDLDTLKRAIAISKREAEIAGEEALSNYEKRLINKELGLD